MKSAAAQKIHKVVIFMAMIFCSKCGKQISDKAAACPHCGAPNVAYAQSAPQPVQQPARAPQNAPAPQRSKTVPFLVLIILLLVVGISVTSITLMKQNKSDSSSSSSKQIITNTNPINDVIAPRDDNTLSFESTTNAQAATQEEFYAVTFKFTSEKNVLPKTKFDTDVIFDGQVLCTLTNNSTKEVPTFYTKRGIHTLRFQKNGDESFYKDVTITINGDTSLYYSFHKHYGVDETFTITEK